MDMKKIIYWALLLCAVVMSGCIKRSDIVFHKVEGVNFFGQTGMEMALKVENKAGVNVKLHSGVMILSLDGRPALEVSLKEQVVIPKRSETTIVLPLKMRLVNPIAALSLMGGGIGDKASRITVSGKATAKVGLAKKRYEVDDMPLGDLLAKFGVSNPGQIGI